MNDQMLVGIVVVAVVCGVAVAVMLINRKLAELKSSSAVDFLKQDVTELSRGIASLQQALGDKLERNNTSMQTSMQKQLGESAKLVADVTQRLAKLDETNRRVVDVADELKTLQNVLQNPKQRGVFGEYYLESVLENILPSKNYQMQYRFKDGEIVDAVVFLDKGQILPIDSKFSLENYNRMVAVNDKEERTKLLARVRTDLKGRIDETANIFVRVRGRWNLPLCSFRVNRFITIC